MTNRLKRIVKAFIAISKGKELTITNVNLKIVHPSQLLSDKTILVTGGSSGIGKAIAKSSLQSGATVIITARNENKLKSAKEELSQFSANIHSMPMDITDVESFKECIMKAEILTGTKPNVLINNAGIAKGGYRDLKEIDFDKVIDTNLKGTFFLSKEFADYMIANNIKGNILNMVSSSGFRPALSAYALSKWSLRGMTLGFAKKLTPYGIVVNGIAPGPTATSMLMDEKNTNMYHPTNPSGRFTTPEEIATLAVYLISDMGRQIVGDVVCIGGGAAITTFDDVNY